VRSRVIPATRKSGTAGTVVGDSKLHSVAAPVLGEAFGPSSGVPRVVDLLMFLRRVFFNEYQVHIF